MTARPPIDAVYPALGLHLRRRRLSPCPVCKADTVSRGDRRRGPIYYRDTGWRCYACNAKGDTLTLIAWVVEGAPKPGAPTFRWLEQAGHDTESHAELQLRPVTIRRPPRAELLRTLRSSRQLTSSPEAVAFLERRKIPPSCPARVLGDYVPSWWGRQWPLIVPMYDACGVVRSMHGRDITGRAPHKTAWPRGYDAVGLFFADAGGLRLLRRGEAKRVLICEGMTDYLAASARWDGATLGVTSGSARALRGVQWPDGAQLYIATDRDRAGEEYARAIGAAVAPLTTRRIAC